MNTPMTLPIEAIRVGHCIELNGEGCSVEYIEDQPDDESFYLTVCFDGARYDEGVTVPYGTEVVMLSLPQYTAAAKEWAEKVAAEHAAHLASFDTEYPMRRAG